MGSIEVIGSKGLSTHDNVNYTILGTDARRVLEGVFDLSSSELFSIDCAYLSKGVYVLRIESGSFIVSKKIIKYD